MVDGGWSDWSDTVCNATCGPGFMDQERFCDDPAPANSGDGCTGDSVQATSNPCNLGPCPGIQMAHL